MNPLAEPLTRALAGESGWLASMVWKSLVILALISVATGCWRRGAAAARHLAWTAGFVCLLCLPAFVRCVPAWRAPGWMVPSGLNNHSPQSVRFTSLGALEPVSGLPPATPGAAGDAPRPRAVPVPVGQTPRAALGWSEIGVATWVAGILIGLARFLTIQIRLHRMLRRTRAAENPEWWRLLEDLRRDARIRRPVRLLITDAAVTPMTWGIWRPVILLSGESVGWPDERLRMVLRHELAHVKRWDCLTQEIAYAACLLYWFNPLAWLGARRMRAEREKACDDWVLNAGARPSEYAGHLVEIARRFAGAAPPGGAVAMARASGLERRVGAILDGRRNRNALGGLAAATIVSAVLGLELLVGGCVTEGHAANAWSLEHSAVAGQWKQFVSEKEAQENRLAEADEKDFAERYSQRYQFVRPDCEPFFAAAAKGDWLAMSNLWSELEAGTLGVGLTHATSGYPHGMWLAPVRETYGALEAFAVGDEKYSKAFGDDIIRSIPAGGIYFGGTDPGRFIITAMCKSQVDADPFFVLTQNALADGSYLDYLRNMYGSKIYIPTPEDSQRCFQDYIKDAQKRYEMHQLKPGEHFEMDTNSGRIQVSGQTAVMEINGLLAKVIFDRNPGHEFYIEQSFPLDWMYPYLEPHGLIFKINRQPLTELPEAVVQRDHEYWRGLVKGMIGGWLTDDTPVKDVTAFAERLFLRHDYAGFRGDRQFVQNDYACKTFSKERANIAGLYVWRMNHAASDGEKERMAGEADFAYRQALALCPYSPEAVKGYEDFLKGQNRRADATLVSEMAAKFPSSTKANRAESHKPGEPAPKPAAVLQVRLVLDSPSADAEPMKQAHRRADGETYQEKLYVQQEVLLDQTAVESANVVKDPRGMPEIQITFTDSGRKQFADVTRRCLDKRLAIIIDGQVRCAPVIRSEISGGTAMISGVFSDQEAETLAAKINEAIARSK